MRKALVIFALLIIVIGVVVSFSKEEHYVEELVVDKWDVTPSVLNPIGEPENATYIAFRDRAEINARNLKFDFNVSALELNINTSSPVSVKVGTISYTSIGYETVDWELINLVFEDYKKQFNDRIEVDGTKADFLEIKNNGTIPVSISGYIKTMGRTLRTVYPYSNFGTLIVLVGVALLIYGFAAKPSRKRRIKDRKGAFDQSKTQFKHIKYR